MAQHHNKCAPADCSACNHEREPDDNPVEYDKYSQELVIFNAGPSAFPFLPTSLSQPNSVYGYGIPYGASYGASHIKHFNYPSGVLPEFEIGAVVIVDGDKSKIYEVVERPGIIVEVAGVAPASPTSDIFLREFQRPITIGPIEPHRLQRISGLEAIATAGESLIHNPVVEDFTE